MHPGEFERRLDNPMTMGNLDPQGDRICRGRLDQTDGECDVCAERVECAGESGLDLDAGWPECRARGCWRDCDSEKCLERPEDDEGEVG